MRRVAIALRLYGIAYEHRPWSTFGDAAKLEQYNPLLRVPTLILDDGEVLIESTAILDYLDERIGPAKALIALSGPERRHGLTICALATGMADKAVSLLYERALHREASPLWLERCRAQITATLTMLEARRASVAGAYWFGDRLGHADVAVACALRFTREAHPGLFDARLFPALAAHAAQCENLPVFQEIAQTLIPPS